LLIGINPALGRHRMTASSFPNSNQHRLRAHSAVSVPATKPTMKPTMKSADVGHAVPAAKPTMKPAEVGHAVTAVWSAMHVAHVEMVLPLVAVPMVAQMSTIPTVPAVCRVGICNIGGIP
jgi:hypothetical protein